jgi:hypothetical protein
VHFENQQVVLEKLCFSKCNNQILCRKYGLFVLSKEICQLNYKLNYKQYYAKLSSLEFMSNYKVLQNIRLIQVFHDDFINHRQLMFTRDAKKWK